jgi:hypothetical protein
MMFNYNIHDLVSICSDKSLDTKYIELPDVFRVENLDDPDIRIRVQKINRKDYSNGERVGDKFRWSDDHIYLDWGAPSIVNLQAMIKGAEQPKTELIFSPFFWRFGDAPYIIGSIISIHLLRHNVTPVHAACISIQGRNVLISGLSNMGKTSTILNLMSSSTDAQLYADDTLILGEDQIYSFPRAVGISPATDTGKIGLSNKNKATKIIRDRVLNAPVISTFLKNRGSIDLKQNIIRTCRPHVCYFLREGATGIQKLDPGVAAKLLFDSTQTLLHYRMNAHHSISTYSYMKKNDLDLFKLEVERRSLIESFFENVDCYEISSNKKGEFAKIIQDHVI